MHPTQNRPPRAQAIKERRESRAWMRANNYAKSHWTAPVVLTPAKAAATA